VCLLVRVPGCRCMCYLSLILCSGGAFLATLSVIVNLIGKTVVLKPAMLGISDFRVL